MLGNYQPSHSLQRHLFLLLRPLIEGDLNSEIGMGRLQSIEMTQIWEVSILKMKIILILFVQPEIPPHSS